MTPMITLAGVAQLSKSRGLDVETMFSVYDSLEGVSGNMRGVCSETVDSSYS